VKLKRRQAKGRPRPKWDQKIREDVKQKEEHGRN
jgi:hypothetical protein